jgi:hypothetical protein
VTSVWKYVTKSVKKKIRDFWTKKDFESGAFLWVGRVRANKHIFFYGLIVTKDTGY